MRSDVNPIITYASLYRNLHNGSNFWEQDIFLRSNISVIILIALSVFDHVINNLS